MAGGGAWDGRGMSEGAQYELDLVCIGRTSVDLYAEQEGARLEDVQSFRKYVGGSATNIAVGTARLGVKTAMLTRVGNEHMGRFVRRTLAENGVDVSYVLFDPEHLTPYVLSPSGRSKTSRGSSPTAMPPTSLSERKTSPRTSSPPPRRCWSRERRSRAQGSRAASVKAIRAAREAGTRVLFDLDYRPVFWGVATHEQGGEMFVESEKVTEGYRSVLPGCDLVVGHGGGDPDSRRLDRHPRGAP